MLQKFGQKRSWLFILSLTVVVAIVLLLTVYSNQRPALMKATWIWEAPSIVTDREEILNFSKQNGVTHIYLYIDRERASPNDYALFIQEASKLGIKVEALGGDPSWGWKEQRQSLKAFIEWVASYNVNVGENERFSGIHLDIEPYLLPEWETDQTRVIEEWLSNMEFAAKQAEWSGGLDVSVDLPFWIQKIEVPGYDNYFAGTWMLKRFDTLVLMDYRDTAEGPDGIISNALVMAEEASAMNKSLVIGVEMAPSQEGNSITFYEEGSEVMEQELEITRQQLRQYSAFKGVAIHGIPYWMSKGE